MYLPHLDYDFQRFGPSFEGAESRLQEVDELVGNIAKAAKEQGSRVIVVSEYGIQPVTQAIHINRHLREKSWLQTRSGPFGEMLDPFQSKVFAVADHQVAHVYVREKHFIPTVREFLLGLPGIESAFAGADRDAIQLNHSHAGDLVAIAKPNAWFTYYYWLDDRLAPDFARTVDIHRKPGYDPCELFINPNLPMPGLLAATKILKKKLGMRYLMDLIPLDATLVRGSHGAPPRDPLDGPIWICNFKQSPIQSMSMTQVPQKVLEAMELDD